MNSKLKSTTFWLTVSIVIMNPVAWAVDYWRTMKYLQYMVENGLKPEQLSFAFTSLPLTTIATAAVTAVTAYVGGNKGRNIAQNIKQGKTNNG